MCDVEAALAIDAKMRAAFSALAQNDTAWRAAARSAMFHPAVPLHETATRGSRAIEIAAVAILLLVRALPKMNDALAWGVGVQVIALTAIMVWVTVLASKSPDSRCSPTSLML
jgi:hypothetical protein